MGRPTPARSFTAARRRGVPHGTLLVALVLAAALIPSPAPASPAGGGRGAAGPATPGRWASVRATAMHRLDAVRTGMSSGRLGDAVAAAARMAGLRFPLVPVPSPAAPAAPGTPPAIAASVGRILAASAEAATRARGALRQDPASLLALEQRLMLAVRDARSTPGGAAALAALAGPAARAVDRPQLYAAGSLLARALDESLPALRAYAGALPRTGLAVDACDVVDLTPALCIGGTGDNTYTQDEALLIDLGGDDTYHNTAGGADPLQSDLATSVNIDLAGDDTYDTETPSPNPTGSLVAQGSGNIGGLGVLLDVAGDDTYTINVGDPKTAGFPISQGQGYGGAGVGILQDLGGDDRYTLVNAGLGESCAFVGCFGASAQGQALGVLAGLGLLIDEGAGADDYLIDSRPVPFETPEGYLNPGTADAIGMGEGAAADAVFFDDGGSDVMTLRSVVPPVAPDEPRPVVPPRAGAAGFGIGVLGGAGAAVSGPGPTVRTLLSSVSAPQAGTFLDGANAGGLGYASFGGFGGISDAGGDDVYVMSVTARGIRRLQGSDPCACAPLQSVATTAGAEILGGGGGDTGGVGAFRDEGGADRYTLAATSAATATARTTAVTDSNGASARAEAGPAFVSGLGLGSTAGAGFFSDEGGDDRYVVRTRSAAVSSAAAMTAGAATDAIAQSGSALAQGEAAGFAGYGEFRDEGGLDSYVSSSTSTARADPDHGAASGDQVLWLQAVVGSAGTALFADVDGGAADVFDSRPGLPACRGERGIGVWVDCGQSLGIGVNA